MPDGVQPQAAVDAHGRVHVIYFHGESSHGDLFYMRSTDSVAGWSEPIRVNSTPGTAIATGTVRGGQIALAPGEREEGKRHIWVARSMDDGRTFEHERPAWNQPTGACGCCGLGAFVDTHDALYVLFRSAFDLVNRDMYLLTSHDGGAHFKGVQIDKWNVGICVMSTQAFAEGVTGVFTAWETKGQVYLGRIDPETGQLSWVAGAPGEDRTRKHPALAVDAAGNVLFAWTEGTAWNKGGSAAWQLFDADGHLTGPSGRAAGVPVWGRVAAYAGVHGFTILY